MEIYYCQETKKNVFILGYSSDYTKIQELYDKRKKIANKYNFDINDIIHYKIKDSFTVALICVAGVFSCIANVIYGMIIYNPIIIYISLIVFIMLSYIVTTIDDRPIN